MQFAFPKRCRETRSGSYTKINLRVFNYSTYVKTTRAHVQNNAMLEGRRGTAGDLGGCQDANANVRCNVHTNLLKNEGQQNAI